MKYSVSSDSAVHSAGCVACPRACGGHRENGGLGVCGCPADFRISRPALHRWEEPPISGTRGSGTVFFAGCSLRCVFCQNRSISLGGQGRPFSSEALIDALFRLKDAGAQNINLVTPTHYANALIPVLEKVRPSLGLPIVYNCGGYESVATLRRLNGLIDIYLPDFKYVSSELSGRYSSAPDYFTVAGAAVQEMYRQVGPARFASEGSDVPHADEKAGDRMVRGLIVRHLVLPGGRKDSLAVLDALASLLPVKEIRLSLLRQFTCDFVDKNAFPELSRRLTTFEYDSVRKHAEPLGFLGYIQGHGSDSAAFTPSFNSPGDFL